MDELTDIASIESRRTGEAMSLLYVSRPSCGICGALKPKVTGMAAERFPKMAVYDINLDRVPEAAGALSVFTIPAILVYAGGRELVREARYVAMDDLERKIARPYRLFFDAE